jgi:lysophospholipase L1-like esterase
MARNKRIPLLLGLLGGSAAVSPYLFWDQFTTDSAAGSVNGTAAEPGPGTRAVTDAGSRLSIASGRLTLAGTQSNNTDPRLVTNAITRVTGLVVTFECQGAQLRAGISKNDASVNDALLFLSNKSYYNIGNDQAELGLPVSSASVYSVCFVIRESGMMIFMKGGVYTGWRVITCRDSLAAVEGTSILANLSVFTGATTAYYDNLAIWLTSGLWTSRFPLATSVMSRPVTGTTLATTADCLITYKINFASGAVVNIRVRYLDDDNHYIVRLTEGTGATGTITIHKMEGGVEGAALATKSSVNFLLSQDSWGYVRCEGATIHVGHTAVFTSYASATFQQTETGVKIDYVNLNKVSLLASQPIAIDPPTEFVGPAKLNLFLIGDSKTVNYLFEFLQDSLEASHGAGAYEHPLRVGKNGGMSSTFAAAIVTDLAARTDTPDLVILNIGVNDATNGTVEANFKTDYAYTLDAIHTKWPSAMILVAHVWGIGYDVECAAVNGWIDTVISSRSWATVGLDELTTLGNGDNGATYMDDALHYNTEGYRVASVAWATASGY